MRSSWRLSLPGLRATTLWLQLILKPSPRNHLPQLHLRSCSLSIAALILCPSTRPILASHLSPPQSSLLGPWTSTSMTTSCLHPSPHLRPTSHQRPSHPQSGILGPWTSTSTATSCIHACLRLTLRLVSSPFPLGTTQMETSL